MTDELRQLLWPKGHNVDVWAIVDGAQDQQVYWTLSNSFLQHSCLFAGTLPQPLEMAAPYLVQLDPEDRFTSFLTDNLHRNLCIFLQFDGSLRELRHHLRKFLSVRDTSGRKMLFRYYDPRVMRVYLPTCTHTELQTVFGRIKTIWTVADDGRNMMQFEIRNKELRATLCKIAGSSVDESAAEIVPAHSALVATKGVEKRARMPILLQGAGRGGVLKRSDNSVRIYRTLTAADEVGFVNNSYTIPATELDPDVTVYAEAIQPGEMTLRLETAAGARAAKKITTVELTLDGGAEVVSIPVAGAPTATRRRIDVLPPKPETFRGKLSLRCAGGPAITLYTERDAASGHPLAEGYTFEAPQEKISFWLEGAAASPALADVKLQLGVEGNNAVGHMLPATVVALSPVRVEVPVTPSKSRREPHAEVEQPAGAPLVLLSGAALDAALAVRLQVESKPAGAKITWTAERHEDDGEAIRALSDNPLPGLEPTETGAAMTTGAAGTFTIRAVAREGEGWGGPESELEVVLVHAALKRNSSSVNGRFCACARTPGTDEIRLHSGNEAAVKLEAMIALTGGGPDGTRGVDAIRSGWINNIVSDNNGARYRGGVTLREGYQDSTGAEIDFEAGPLLDAPVIASNDPRCMASSVVTVEEGETWVRAGAAPGASWRMQNGGADKPIEQLWRYLECRSYLALWSTASPGQLGVLMQIGWSFTGDFACNAAKMVRAVVPARLVATGSTPYPDVQPASRTDLESHPPVSGRG